MCVFMYIPLQTYLMERIRENVIIMLAYLIQAFISGKYNDTWLLYIHYYARPHGN